MTGRSWSRALSASLVALAAGCGSHGGGGGGNGAPYPAPHPALPRVQSGAGTMLAAPKLTAITFDGDDYAPLVDDFTAKVGASSWWSAVSAGYALGSASSTAPFHDPAPAPQSMTRGDVENLLAAGIQDASLPPPVPGSLYLFFPPPDTQVLDPDLGPSCASWYAFHYAFGTTAGAAAYAVIPRCPAVADLSTLDVLTTDASHEIIEAATDPFQHSGLYGLDPSGEAFGEIAGGVEVADLCSREDYPFLEPDDLPYLVARSWSNQAAAAGDDPCQPAFDAWFGAAPELPDSFTIGPDSTSVTGILIGVGVTRTVTLDLFSEAPGVGDFHLSAYDQESRDLGLETPNVELSFDRDHGVNGDVRQLRIHVRKAGSVLPAHLIVLEATKNGALHRWPFWVAN